MKAIVHVDKNCGIGRGNSLMFRLPADMKFFKDTTTGNTVVMGGNTLRSFPGGNSLKNRRNIVLSSTLPERGDCTIVRTQSQFFDAIKAVSDGEVYVIGGAGIYRMLLPYCSEALVTKFDADGGADTFFPDLDSDENFTLETEGEEQETNGYKIKFCTYINNDVKPLP